jgi:WD40 repeat protein
MRFYSAVVVLLVLPAIALAQDKADKPILVLDAGGHTATVRKVLFTPDGKELITVSDDKTIRFWDVGTGEPLRILRPPIGKGSEGMLLAAALSPDGKTLAVGGLGLTGGEPIYLISVIEGQIARVLKVHRSLAIKGLAFSPDGKRLASTSADKTARVWNVATGVCEHTLKGHTEPLTGVAFSPNGRLVTASNDKTARIWSVQTGRCEAVLHGHTAVVNCVAWSPDGKTIATGSNDQSVRLWEADGSFRKAFETLGNFIRSLSFTSDSRCLLLTRGPFPKNFDCSLVDVGSGREQVCFRQHDNSVWTGAISPDDKLVATAGGHVHLTYIWNVSDGAVVARLGGKGAAVSAAGWGKESQEIAWGTNYLWRSHNDRAPLERAFRLADLEFGLAANRHFRRAQPSRGSLVLEAGNRTAVVAVKRGKESIVQLKLQHESNWVQCFTFLPGGDRAAVGSVFGLFLFDTASGKCLREFHAHTGGIRAVAPSPDNRYLLSASADQTLRVWDPAQDEPLLSLFFTAAEWVAWTPEGYYAASAGGEKLMGWHVNNGLDKMATFYPAAQFRKSLYRPDVIKLLLKAGSLDKALALADKARGKASKRTGIDKILPPRVAITSPARTGLKLDKPELEVRATASSVGDHPVTALRLLVDGRPHQGEGGVRKTAKPKLGKVEASWTVKVDPGKHTLAVQAESAVSKAVSEIVEVFGKGTRGLGQTSEELVRGMHRRPDSDSGALPSLYVLAVGISSYKGDLKLRYAAKDAEALAKVCRAKSKPLFRRVEVKLITDDKATRRQILQGLTWLRKQMTQRDVGMLFFAGHGAKDSDSSFYLLPVDGDPDDLLSTAVAGEQIKRTLAAVPGKILMLLDACHAGAAGGGEKRRAATSLTDDLVRDLVTDDYGVVVMCSSMGREYSLESPTVEHGYFTLALTEGLSGKAANKEGVVYLHTLDAYVTDRVKELSKGQQHPVTAKPTTIRSFPLSKPGR